MCSSRRREEDECREKWSHGAVKGASSAGEARVWPWLSFHGRLPLHNVVSAGTCCCPVDLRDTVLMADKAGQMASKGSESHITPWVRLNNSIVLVITAHS